MFPRHRLGEGLAPARHRRASLAATLFRYAPSFLLPSPEAAEARTVRSSLDNVYLQKVSGRSHGIPGFAAATRKDLLALTLQRMERGGYGAAFAPRTFVLPDQRDAWLRLAGPPSPSKSAESTQPAPSTWIVKPPAESCGDGIVLCSTTAEVDAAAALIGGESQVVSEYIDSPMLLHGHKFDLRLYAVVVRDAAAASSACIKPMKAYLHAELGLARFATTEYSGSSIADVTAHLTNYSINVNSSAFVEETRGKEHEHAAYGGTAAGASPPAPGGGLDAHKWSLPRVLAALGGKGTGLMREVAGVLGKVVAAAEADVKRDSGNALPSERAVGRFELVGVDVMLDERGKPWLLEVQNRPSTDPSSDLDLEVKGGVVRDLKELLGRGEGEEAGAAWIECVWEEAAEATRWAEKDDVDDDLRLKLNRVDQQMQFEAMLLMGAMKNDGQMWN